MFYGFTQVATHKGGVEQNKLLYIQLSLII